MKSRHPIICRPNDLAAEIAESRKNRRAILERSTELLRITQPDTFLGRQHHAFIPLPLDEEDETCRLAASERNNSRTRRGLLSDRDYARHLMDLQFAILESAIARI